MDWYCTGLRHHQETVDLDILVKETGFKNSNHSCSHTLQLAMTNVHQARAKRSLRIEKLPDGSVYASSLHRDGYCSSHFKLVEKQPDHWISKSNLVRYQRFSFGVNRVPQPSGHLENVFFSPGWEDDRMEAVLYHTVISTCWPLLPWHIKIRPGIGSLCGLLLRCQAPWTRLSSWPCSWAPTRAEASAWRRKAFWRKKVMRWWYFLGRFFCWIFFFAANPNPPDPLDANC